MLTAMDKRRRNLQVYNLKNLLKGMDKRRMNVQFINMKKLLTEEETKLRCRK